MRESFNFQLDAGREAIRATDGARVCGYKVSVEASHGRKSKRKTYLEDVRCYKYVFINIVCF